MALKSYAWTTVARVQAFADISSLDAAETIVMENIINSATEYLENYIGRRIQETAHSDEIHDGPGAATLYLKNFPVNTAESFTLQVRSSGLNQNSWSTVDSTRYFVKDTAGYIEAIGGYFFLTGPSKYKISYTAGFSFDNAATFLNDTTAGDLEYVIWQLASGAWARRRGGGTSGIQSESIGDYRVTYAKTLFESEENKAVLDKYRRMEVASYPTPSH